MAIIRNLTPHTIDIIDEDGNIKASYPSEGVARATQTTTVVGEINGVELVSMTYGEPEGLPEPEDDEYFIVSILTANAAKAAGYDISHLLLTNDPVRDDQGRIIGCRKFAVVS